MFPSALAVETFTYCPLITDAAIAIDGGSTAG
jgi:hypothetical protein